MNNWISKLVTPRAKYFLEDDDEKIHCPSCSASLTEEELSSHFSVCKVCDHHFTITPDKRMELVFDTFAGLSFNVSDDDPLSFSDSKPYIERLKNYREKTNSVDAISVYEVSINRLNAICACMNFGFMGGSMGRTVGNALETAINKAISLSLPLIIFTASGGARMQEGCLSLMQMPRTISLMNRFKDAGLLSLCVYTHPTTGGVIASFASQCDVTIAEPKALTGFSGRRIIEQVANLELPNNFQRSEYLLEHGLIDEIIHRKNLNSYLKNFLTIIHSNRIPHW